MITPEAIVEKSKRIFPKAVKAWLEDELTTFFPCRVPCNLLLPTNHADAIAEVELLRQSSKGIRGVGYSVQYESRRSRTYGLNDFPIAIWIETMDDLVRLAGTSLAWKKLQLAVDMIRIRRPELIQWVKRQSNWRSLLDVADDLVGLLGLVDYFQRHPRPGCFARELPIAVSTKLLETHRRPLVYWLDIILPPDAIDYRFGYDDFEPRYGLRYVRPHFLVRILDSDFQAELGCQFDELSLPAESLSRLPVTDAWVVIVENKVNLLTLPALKRTIGLGGLGNGVVQLSDVRWIHDNPVYYWGDLDADGFVILDHLRQSFKDVRSVLMNQHTLDQFQYLATPGNASEQRELTHLTVEEQRCYEDVCRTNRRLEQEHLPNEVFIRALVEMENQPNSI